MAVSSTTKMELIKVEENQIRIINQWPIHYDTVSTLDKESDEGFKDPFGNLVKVQVLAFTKCFHLN